MVATERIGVMDKLDVMIDESAQLVETIRPLLAGRDPAVQAGTMVQLVAIWLAGHAPQIREEILAGLIEAANNIVGEFEKQLFGEHGHPGAGERQ
jgi:hypothetical protein